jgi:hypothetical protein
MELFKLDRRRLILISEITLTTIPTTLLSYLVLYRLEWRLPLQDPWQPQLLRLTIPACLQVLLEYRLSVVFQSPPQRHLERQWCQEERRFLAQHQPANTVNLYYLCWTWILRRTRITIPP